MGRFSNLAVCLIALHSVFVGFAEEQCDSETPETTTGNVMLQARSMSQMRRTHIQTREAVSEDIGLNGHANYTTEGCPASGLSAHDRCWYLGDRKATCMSTCAEKGLAFSMYITDPSDPIMPQLLGKQPGETLRAWSTQECYDAKKDQFRPAKAGGKGLKEPHKLSWSKCALACPCAPTTAYASAGTGVAGPGAKWTIGKAKGKGPEACFAAVMDDKKCSKDYFSYKARGDKECGCRESSEAMTVENDGDSDVYKIGEDVFYRAIGSYADGNPEAMRYGPKRWNYDPITCYMACSQYTYFALQSKGGKCYCENDLAQVTKYGTMADCKYGKAGCNYVYTTDMAPTPAPTAQGGGNCADFDVKLEGATGGRGTPMIYMGGIFYPVCATYFSANHIGAAIFCRQMGYESGRVYPTQEKLTDWAVMVPKCGDASASTLQGCENELQPASGTMHHSRCAAGEPSIEVECFGGEPVETSCGYVKPTPPSPPPPEVAIPDDREKALFLMQTTFGPTRDELVKIDGMTLEAWIGEQMEMPMQSHRETYRSLTNMRWIEGLMDDSYDKTTQCSKGSRWYKHVFHENDVGKSVTVKKSGEIWVAGAHVSDIDPAFVGNGLAAPPAQECSDAPDMSWDRDTCKSTKKNLNLLCSESEEWLDSRICQQTCFDMGLGYSGDDCSGGWVKKSQDGYKGYVCSVMGFVGGVVMLSDNKNCVKTIAVLNPQIWLANPGDDTSLAFDTNPLLPDLMFKAEEESNCELKNAATVTYQGQVYRHQFRMALRTNTIESPSVLLRYENFDGLKKPCAAKNYLNEDGCVLQTPEMAEETGCFALCGSPGEIPNDPTKGHQVPMIHARDHTPPDEQYDNRYGFNLWVEHGRAMVWTEKALKAPDQLRQRMAWALAQILVVGSNQEEENEKYVTYYDMLLRNAFGNYGDLMREVTRSPTMGMFLTYVDSEAFDASGSYPDENYAREIMQVFTIGLYKLNADGTLMKNADGNNVDTYDNMDVLNFARVFTGFTHQDMRANIEVMRFNAVDPMRIEAKSHDIYPKHNLYGGYLGDQYPLCSDVPAGAFLLAGSKYEFIGYIYDGEEYKVFEPSASSALYEALSTPALKVTLDKDLDCFEKECDMENVEVVKVPAGFYRYMRPACVYHFFYNGKYAVRSHHREDPVCFDASLPVAATICCKTCPGGCHHKEYEEQLMCEDASRKVRFVTAESSCSAAGMEVCPIKPKDACGDRKAYIWQSESCSVEVKVLDDGSVHAHTDKYQNSFKVYWTGDRPAPFGVYTAAVELNAVFDKVPSADEIGTLTIGAMAPTIQCSDGCDGDVKAYSSSGTIDADTIFEYGGKYFKNAESIVSIGDYSFRNPPVFFRPGLMGAEDTDADIEQAAWTEVDTLLDHLFYHPNTALSVSKKFIQHFTQSNPSLTYVQDVAAAFKLGAYNGVDYSGKYGDLGAMLHAVLLHPEARLVSDSKVDGLLREPMIKLMHVLRALDYQEADGKMVVLQPLEGDIGQYPYNSPSVFNFFDTEYQPASWMGGSVKKQETDVDLAAHVAPEFQIFTAPYSIRFQNGIDSLFKYGLTKCADGFGMPDLTGKCAGKGSINFNESATLEDTLKELNILLTGGRLTSASMDVVRDAYNEAPEGEGLQAALKAIFFSTEFHNYGDPKEEGARPETPKPAPKEPESYKAMVLIYMIGGADTYHLVTPTDCPLYDEYKERRKGGAHDQKRLLPITTTTQECSKFGLHPALTFVHDLYENKKQAAIMADIGALYEPMTRQEFRFGGAQQCIGLFSHSHQQMASQTLECQTPGAGPRGVGGRIADSLAAQGLTSTSYSIAGSVTWPQGMETYPGILHPGKGIARLNQYDAVKDTLTNITSIKHGNIYCEEYSLTFSEAVEEGETMGALLENVTLVTGYESITKLGKQLMQVARVMLTKDIRKAERDFFFVQFGPFDHHKHLFEDMNEKLKEFDAEIEDFVLELKAQGMWDKTVIITESDFGRTLDWNGDGTDHGWGGNHMVMGGSINGGEMYNKFLTTFEQDSLYDAGRGRVIPKYPWESMLVPVAEWMGVTDAGAVFPNLKNFNRSTHIASGLFAA